MPTRGTTDIILSKAYFHNFNPRAHEGHDCANIQEWDIYIFQSTCPRGARRENHSLPRAGCDFNPRAHEGHDALRALFPDAQVISIHVPTRGTTMNRCMSFRTWYFNPRAHEGHDLCRYVHNPACHYFNPRAHEGHDFADIATATLSDISIHVPTRGTTTDSRKSAF